MGNVDTGKSSTVSNSKQVQSAVNNIAGQLGGMAKPGATSYVAPSTNTLQGWEGSLAAANNPAYAQGLAGAISSYGNRAAGNELGINDPLYAAQRARLSDSIMTDTNKAFNSSGLFGSDSNQSAVGRGLAEGIGALDLAQRGESYGRQSEAANMLPQLLSGAQLPSSIQQAIGSAQDQNNQAQKLGELDWATRLSQALQGTSAAAGSTTTQSKPLWLSMLGIGASAL